MKSALLENLIYDYRDAEFSWPKVAMAIQCATTGYPDEARVRAMIDEAVEAAFRGKYLHTGEAEKEVKKIVAEEFKRKFDCDCAVGCGVGDELHSMGDRIRAIVREEVHGNKGLVQRLNEAERELSAKDAEIARLKILEAQISETIRFHQVQYGKMQERKDAEIEKLKSQLPPCDTCQDQAACVCPAVNLARKPREEAGAADCCHIWGRTGCQKCGVPFPGYGILAEPDARKPREETDAEESTKVGLLAPAPKEEQP